MSPGIGAIGGGGGPTSLGDTDSSSQTSGNLGGSSADRISKQFITINGGGGGTSALDLNSYLYSANAGFYNAISGEQKLEAGAMGNKTSNTFKYVALGAGVIVSLFAAIAFKGGK